MNDNSPWNEQEVAAFAARTDLGSIEEAKKILTDVLKATAEGGETARVKEMNARIFHTGPRAA